MQIAQRGAGAIDLVDHEQVAAAVDRDALGAAAEVVGRLGRVMFGQPL